LQSDCPILGAQLLVNNAGAVDGYKELHEVTEEDILHCFRVNAVGPLLVTQQLHQRGLLGGRRGGSLVANMTSKARREHGLRFQASSSCCEHCALCTMAAPFVGGSQGPKGVLLRLRAADGQRGRQRQRRQLRLPRQQGSPEHWCGFHGSCSCFCGSMGAMPPLTGAVACRPKHLQ
jgi:NAD(P)-dependent dehydrogenase (short-subunit alcohol dehydrogenase family)